ncbi:MAG: TIGR02391 family protein [bacterium]
MQNIQEQINDELELKFDLKTIEHLGIQMYKTLPPVLAELISNSYDADATIVNIEFFDRENGDKQIVVSDDGLGMSFEEINQSFLVVGKNRRENEQGEYTPRGRKVTGRKGLGKLAIFGIAEKIQIQTIKGGIKNVFEMDLNKIFATKTPPYKPDIVTKNEPTTLPSGTRLVLSEIKRRAPFNIEEIKESVAKRFAFAVDDFIVFLGDNKSESLAIDNNTKWGYIQVLNDWKFPESDCSRDSFASTNGIEGAIITSEKPLKEDQRGIFLYARGKLVNPNEFYGVKATLSLAYNYMTGFLNVDYVDDFSKDFIITSRDGLIWEREELQPLRYWLKEQIQNIEKQWNDKRTEHKENKISKKLGVNFKTWTDTMPPQIQKSITNLVSKILDKPEIDEEIAMGFVSDLRTIVPEYPKYHWRELHPQIKAISEQYYKEQNYYTAFLEACKKYKNAVKTKANLNIDDEYQIMVQAFGEKDTKKLKVTKKYTIRPQGETFGQTTLNNIEEGQMCLSQGVVKGARNVLSHEEIVDLRETGLFSEKDCLDMLSILSHLFKRLDDA